MNLSCAVRYFSRKHFSLFSEKKVCVSRWSQGRQLHSSPYWGTDEKHCPLLTDTGASLSEAWYFWGVYELVIYSLLTSQNCLPKGKRNFPHLRTHRDAHLPLFLGTDTGLPLGQGLKVFLKPCKSLLCHLPFSLILQAFSFLSQSQTRIHSLPASLPVATNSYSYCLVQYVQQAASWAWCDHNLFWISPLPSPNFLPVFHFTISHPNLLYNFALALLSIHVLYWKHSFFLDTSQCYQDSEVLI